MQISAAAIQQISLARLQPFAVPGIFSLFGLTLGSWASRIPALRDGLGLSHGSLSWVLLCGGLGAVLSFPISSRLMAKFGGRKTVLFAGLALLAVLMAIAMAPSMPLLMLAVLSLGITAACFDVGVNSVASKIEKASGKSQMAKFHGWGCAGSLAGALLGSVMASMQIVPEVHFTMVAFPVALLLWLSVEALDMEDDAEVIEKKRFSLPSGPLALLGAIGFFAAMSEGSIADWSGVFMKDHFGVSDGFAPLGLSAFMVMMLIARLMGDRLKEKHGARRLVTAGAATAATGLLFAVLAPNAYLALAGFALGGLGLALVFPFVFSAAGSMGPAALAGVATMAYSGSLMGPPVVGALAHHMGMQAAMGFVGMLSIVIAAIASRTVLLK